MRVNILLIMSLLFCFCEKINNFDPLLSKILINGNIQEIVIDNNPNIKDYTPIISRLLENSDEDVILKFTRGTYHFYPEKAAQFYTEISNNDNGFHKIIFPISNSSNFSVYGNNSDFVFHGGVIPFQFKNSNNISLDGINLYWDKPFTFEGEVISTSENKNSFSIKVNEANDYEIKNGVLFFKGYDWKLPISESYIFNKNSSGTIINNDVQNFENSKLKAFESSKGIIEFTDSHKVLKLPQIGSIFVDKGLKSLNKKFPAINFFRCNNIKVSNVNIYASGGMALVAEFCASIKLEKFNVLLPEISKQMVSATDDAVHFADCKNKLSIVDCIFQYTMGNAININSSHMLITEILGEYSIGLKPVYDLQKGDHFAIKGDTVQIISNKNFTRVENNIVKSIDKINEAYSILTFENKISKSVIANSLLKNKSWISDVTIKNCMIDQNSKHGILISCAKKVMVKDNNFSNIQSAIKVGESYNGRFDLSTISNMTIQDNKFENIGKSSLDTASILQINTTGRPHCDDNNIFFYNKISFNNNLIKDSTPQILYASKVNKLYINDNEILPVKSEKKSSKKMYTFDIQRSNDVKLLRNKYLGKDLTWINTYSCKSVKLVDNKGFFNSPSNKLNSYFFN